MFVFLFLFNIIFLINFLINLTSALSYYTIYNKVIYNSKASIFIKNIEVYNPFLKKNKKININSNDNYFLLNFVYFTCKTYCPILLKESINILDKINKKYKNIYLITISFDSINDNYYSIEKFWVNYGKKKKWNFLIINKENIFFLKKNGFPFWCKKDKFNNLIHTNFFILLNKELKIIKLYKQVF